MDLHLEATPALLILEEHALFLGETAVLLGLVLLLLLDQHYGHGDLLRRRRITLLIKSLLFFFLLLIFLLGQGLWDLNVLHFVLRIGVVDR